LQDSKTLVAALEKRGVETFTCPMLTIAIRQNAAVDLTGVQAVLFTSANGVRAFAALTSRRDLPVYAVGDRTATVAEENRFVDVVSAGGDVTKLAKLVTKNCRPGDGVFLHPAGTAVAGDLAGQLSAAGFVVRRTVIYDAQPATGFSGEIRMALLDKEIDIVLFYSPRSAATFVTLAKAEGLEPACEILEALCLSDGVATAADPIMWRRVLVAPEPTQAALLATLDERLSSR
jgi:uroporphyrinogen-III synthase